MTPPLPERGSRWRHIDGSVDEVCDTFTRRGAVTIRFVEVEGPHGSPARGEHTREWVTGGDTDWYFYHPEQVQVPAPAPALQADLPALIPAGAVIVGVAYHLPGAPDVVYSWRREVMS